ncbi:MAG: GLPGLI family protein [Sediminibacterium sp.]|uniref:GLPGLI family protein n=1 Tax=Sediminibacterium sp. TaxID=1917865 RepID=UPI002ABA0366|nr:GLPGLI family protein [Sediminibacterium sp.]MDZ4070687.1 GLPGLI family protein [Sediminibacterium sp.]
MKKLMTFLFVLAFLNSFSQARFISSGRIEFERKYNQHSQFEGQEEGIWVAEMKKNYPKMVTDFYELRFNSEKSVYKLMKENPDNKYLWMGKPNESDVAVKDLAKGTLSIQRDVFEQTYIIQDSLRQLEWRITDETRTIAGFECKKAVTRICDSVYVVAFYTDQILVNSGPESFSGLPGMILGLAVPRLHTTWFATKVELIEPTPGQLFPSQKGKKATWQQVSADLNKAMKDWGRGADRILWSALL